MSTGIIIVLAVAVVIIVAVVLAPRVRKSGGTNLRQRFGPEYDRTVARHDGDTQAAEKDLSERLRRHGDLRARPLTAEARESYVALWAGVQEQFVDSPETAVAEADRLLVRLVRDRGYPADDYDEQVAALSVHHTHHVDGYRQVHAVASRARTGRAGTEELREVLVHARALFEDLVGTHPQDNVRHRAGDRTGNRAAERPAARPGATGGNKRLSDRLHAPWTSGHRDRDTSPRGGV
ncbi:hypothetical protein [Streptomyces sp. Ru87]|uniref:hypothetical protein n=1 Tax=Streptomyces sp. Ru87 TaxID=2044307 RepID=UPI000BF5199A|nr:hypothetical protein [Streptomyces sp. Ru87]PGH50595.1 hypothetical protein CRI70_11240 [Streptomyces sp. Ru87]